MGSASPDREESRWAYGDAQRPRRIERMDERGSHRGATGSGGRRQSGRPAAKPRDGSGQPQGGSRRPQGGSGQPQGGSGRPQGGSGRPQGGSGRPQGGSGRPQGGSGRKPAGGGRKVTGSGRKAAARRRRERRRRAIIASLVAAVAVIVVVVVMLVANRGSTPTTTTAGYDRVATFSGLSRNHTSSPVGGNHNSVWQNCGYYSKPVRNENAVHSLEHGAVWITYQPNLPKDQADRLAALGRGQSYTLVSPYPGLPAPVVASGWGVQEWFHTASDPKLNEFLSKYRQGPQTPEPGAQCTNGTGT